MTSEAFPLSPQQELEWAGSRALGAEASSIYGLWFDFRSVSERDRLVEACRYAFNVHPMLCARTVGTTLTQRLASAEAASTPIIKRADSVAAHADAMEAVVDSLRESEPRDGIRSAVAVVDSTATSGTVGILLPHLFADLIGRHAVNRTVTRHFRGAREDGSSPRPYSRFVDEQLALLRSDEATRRFGFWRRQLGNASLTAQPRWTSSQPAEISIEIDARRLSQILDNTSGRTSFAYAFAVLLREALAPAIEGEDVVIGLARLNRALPYRHTVGSFQDTTLLPLRRHGSFAAAVDAVAGAVADADEHYLPVAALTARVEAESYEHGAEARLVRFPLVNWLGRSRVASRSPAPRRSILATTTARDTSSRAYHLTLEVGDDGVSGSLQVDPDVRGDVADAWADAVTAASTRRTFRRSSESNARGGYRGYRIASDELRPVFGWLGVEVVQVHQSVCVCAAPRIDVEVTSPTNNVMDLVHRLRLASGPAADLPLLKNFTAAVPPSRSECPLDAPADAVENLVSQTVRAAFGIDPDDRHFGMQGLRHAHYVVLAERLGEAFDCEVRHVLRFPTPSLLQDALEYYANLKHRAPHGDA